MKKYIMIFSSFILALLILLLPNNNVYAEELGTKDLNYSDLSSRVESFQPYLDEVVNYLSDYNDLYYYFIVVGNPNVNVYVYEKNVNFDLYLKLDTTSSNIQTTKNNVKFKDLGFYFNANNFETNFNSFKTSLEAGKLYSSQYGTTFSASFSANGPLNINYIPFIYYTNYAGFKLHSDSVYNLNLNGELITPGSTMPSYYDWLEGSQVEPTIEMTKTWANDLDNNDIYIIRSDFTNSFNANYKYQIKTDYTDWLDVTSDVLLASQSGYYFYDYTLKYNSKLYARVLDPNNEVVVTNEIEVTELNDYIEISHLPANDLQNRYINVIKFDLRHAYNENYIFQYSYDNKTFYNMSVDIDNQIFYLNHAVNIPIYFRIIDNSSNLIYERKYDVYFSDLEKEILIKEKTNFIDDVKSININLDFTEYLNFFDMYNFKIIVDGVIYNEETSLLTLVSTEDNFIKYIDIRVYIDDLLIEDIGYRTGTFGGGGGSDIDNFEDMYDKVLENELNNELLENNYDNVNNMIKSAQKFLESIVDIVTKFFDLIMTFFNRLNIWIRVFIINLFVVFVVCKTIKAVRK